MTQTVEDLDGNRRMLSDYAGKVAVVVNVASSCGFTASNYRGLQFLYDKYKDYDFTVSQLGFLQPNLAHALAVCMQSVSANTIMS